MRRADVKVLSVIEANGMIPTRALRLGVGLDTWEVSCVGRLVTVDASATAVLRVPMPGGDPLDQGRRKNDGMRILNRWLNTMVFDDFVKTCASWTLASSVPAQRFDTQRFVQTYRDLAEKRFAAGELGDDPSIIERVAGQAGAHGFNADAADEFARFCRFIYTDAEGIADWCPRVENVADFVTVDERFADTMFRAGLAFEFVSPLR